MKKVLVLGLACLTLSGMTIPVFASTNKNEIWSSPVDLKGEKPISTFVTSSEDSPIGNIRTLSVRAGDVKFVHDSGFEYSGSGNALNERVWGETSHVQDGKAVDGYTRARYEKGSSIKADSGRKWDSDDGKIHGYSKATSGWVLDEWFYRAHTYYGNER